MAATQTVPQEVESRNFTPIVPQRGVVTLFGYGIKVHVDRGHLTIQDGIGAVRREARLPRIGHGLRRLVVIGSDGFVSLAALRWLADQDASFLMLNRDGSVLATTGPARSSDARLRRAQALAHHSGVALQLAKDLLDKKLTAQEQLVRDKLRDSVAADRIAEMRRGFPICQSVDALRPLEALAAKAYWSVWRPVLVGFPTKDLSRVPEHWKTFGTRVSPLTGSPRLAVNPPNAMLNYLYALLESEARLAAAALGLDPGLGVMHFDSPTRDSLASDLMEPIRPRVDAYVLDWLMRGPLRREWFFEQRDGNCRLMASFAQQLSETAPAWASAVAPVAEQVSRMLSASIPKRAKRVFPSTRLTQNSRREGRGISPDLSVEAPPRPATACRMCGKPTRGTECCQECVPLASGERLTNAAKRGRIASHTPEAKALRAETMRRQEAARRAWKPSDLPEWLNEVVYREKIQPELATGTIRSIMEALQVSKPYAADIRSGKKMPHPRHWLLLARLSGVRETAKPSPHIDEMTISF
ncbi:MAG TPA: CRISPR-associated endonuclease Cas1 [Candidatus Acidoferrales bacterium]|nr:CRISPR-associated endonuclease Cas1 [Candidatus Acidoferrales bacterium]